jgi:hypothetical protein
MMDGSIADDMISACMGHAPNWQARIHSISAIEESWASSTDTT